MIPTGVVDVDGVLMPSRDAKISVFDRGFLYGDSAFEAMRTYGGRPHYGRRHIERLLLSCERLRIAMPITSDALESRISAAIAGTGLAECYLRLVVTRGKGSMGLDLQPAMQSSLLIYALELSLPEPAVYREGITAGLVQVQRVTDLNSATGAKTSNYLASLLALDDVKRRGLREAIILGSRGEVLEGATSNVFAVRSGELHTPPISAGILEGITRHVVIELAAGLGIVCHERELLPDDLLGADEVFLTSSIRELVPVVRVEQARIADGAPGPVFAALLDAYRRNAITA
jgi:branched-chain amino acid aminotransferase